MMSVKVSIILNSGSLILGAASWLLAVLAITASQIIASHRNTVLSFTFCAFSLVAQLFEICNRVNIGDYAAIEDTIKAVLISAIILVVVTVTLNIIALKKSKNK